jgi:predicted GTPase
MTKHQPLRKATLQEAIDRAVKEGLQAAGEMEDNFDQIGSELQKAIDALLPWVARDKQGQRQSKGAAAVFIGALSSSRADIKELFSRQRANLSTVNLAFFGRTGAGKSSLIEALTHGSGESVSKGESDWTVAVRPVVWNGCTLLDTPGINGWGRNVNRSTLEQHARKAVETADIVLLCFDSQSQQEAEFEKVAQWIQAYGKPVIAVLNSRNQHWRFPPRVELLAQRRSLSQMVHQHIGNIQDGLSSLGLADVPVLAISSKRALMARGKEPFHGPDEKTFTKLRAEFGCADLLKWSNLPALEGLLIGALEQGASTIRLGMLNAQVRGIVARLDGELGQVIGEADKVATAVDKSVLAIIAALGYPAKKAGARNAYMDPDRKVDLIAQAEVLRDEPFQAPDEGEFQVYAQQLLTAHLSQIRNATLRRAEEFVIEAFNERKHLDQKAFAKAVYRKPEMTEASKKILEFGSSFLQRKVKLAVRTAQVEIAVHEQATEIKGNSGGPWRKLGGAARAAGILTGSATTIAVSLAAANIWNPAGWILAAVSVGGGILSTVLGWLGGKSERKAEETRSKARREALSLARRHVNDTLDEFTGNVAAAVAGQARDAAATTLVPLLQELIASRLIVLAAAEARKRFATLTQSLPQREPQQIISLAARGIERETYPSNRKAANLLWRGDDWIADPLGLRTDVRLAPLAVSESFAAARECEAAAMRALFALQSPAPALATAWMRRVHKAAATIPHLRRPVQELVALAGCPLPRLHIFGDYNAGKSSFIKRLLIESGEVLPDTLAVRADPTTTTVVAYPWEGILLVDSPGLQSRRDEDNILALSSFADASFMLFVLQPSLLGSTLDTICPILLGDDARGIEPKLERALFIIGRADELGPDPEDDIKEYTRACNRKRRELIRALERRGVQVPDEHVLCVAADPYGHAGARSNVAPHEYDRTRAWDGIAALTTAIKAISNKSKRAAVARSVLDAGVMRLTGCLQEVQAEHEHVTYQSNTLKNLTVLLGAAVSAGARLENNIAGKLDRLLDEATAGLIADALGATDDVELQHAANSLENWWKQDEFKSNLDRWQKQSCDEVDSWYRRTSDEIGRALVGAHFVTAEMGGPQAYDGEALKPPSGDKRKGLWSTFENVVNASAKRDVVYKVGKMIGLKFKPYGAIKLAGKMAKFGAVLSAAGVALDAISWRRAAKSAAKREKARLQAAKYIRESSEHIKASLIAKGSKSGIGAYLDTQVAELNKVKAEVDTERAAKNQLERTLDLQMRKLQSLLDAARAHRSA